MKKLIINSLLTLSILSIIWIGISYIDVMANRDSNPDYADWNFFSVVVNIAEEVR